MSDPIEELFRSARPGLGAEGGDVPLSAAEVRRRGDRIRRRRNALVAGGAALAVAAVAVPVFALSGGHPKAGGNDHLAGDPTTTATATPTGLSEDNLITDDDTVYTPGVADWFTTDTSPGDGQSAFHPCAREGLAGLGATSVFRRDFELRNLERGAPDVKGDHLGEAVAEFGSPTDARAAYKTIAGWVLDCKRSLPDYHVVPEGRSVAVTGGDAIIYDSHWSADDPALEEAVIAETGIAVVGNRLAVLSLTILGQDYDFPPGGTPVQQMLAAAAQRLTS